MKYYLKAWSNVTNFKSRSTRAEFWAFFGINLGIIAFLAFLLSVFFMLNSQTLVAILGVIYIVYVLVTILPTLALGVRRLHDAGYSGWLYLIGFIPIIGTLAVLILSLFDSQAGENKYGPNSKRFRDF